MSQILAHIAVHYPMIKAILPDFKHVDISDCWEFRNTKTWWPKMARVHTKFPENVRHFSNLKQCLTHRDFMVLL